MHAFERFVITTAGQIPRFEPRIDIDRIGQNLQILQLATGKTLHVVVGNAHPTDVALIY